MIRVFLLMDIRYNREALAYALAAHSGIELVGEASNDGDGRILISGLQPDTVVVDMSSAGSISAVRQIVAACERTAVIGVSVAATESHIIECAEAGVAGIVLRDGTLAELIAAIEHAVRGELACSPYVSGVLTRRLASLAERRGKREQYDNLTPREREIVELIDQGRSNKEIARLLGIRVPTVKNHVHNILEKLQVSRRSQAAALMRAAAREQAPHSAYSP